MPLAHCHAAGSETELNDGFSRVETLNVHSERSRLTPEQRAGWHGLPVEWFDAAPRVRHRNFFMALPVVAMLDAGEAQARFDFGGGVQTFEMRAGALRVFDGRHACRLNEWSCRSARRIMVELGAPHFADAEALGGLRQDLDFRDDALAGLLRAMVREVAEGCPHGALYAESLSAGVLLRLQQTHGRKRRERGVLTLAQLGRVDELIAEGTVGGPTLAALADATGYSRAQFVRLFRRTTGTSPHRYVLQQRLEQAQRLIVGSGMPLAEVASATGFASQSHLSSAFVRHFGNTPGQARRAARR
jgi:AraC family transcriptional regulator